MYFRLMQNNFYAAGSIRAATTTLPGTNDFLKKAAT